LKLRELYNPFHDKNIKSDERKTIFIGKLNYATDEVRLKKEFEIFGPIKSIRIVKNNKNGKSRGYGFVEYETIRDCELALRKGD
jgi:U1 small nuclear ribonucleoprotein